MGRENDLDLGTPGESARREHRRRRESRERRTLQRHRHLGRLLVAVRDAPRDEEQWKVGAEGEQLVARSLAHRCPKLIVLHDRRLPSSRSNIDHIAVAPSGVWVIDAKRYRGKIQVKRPLLGEPKLTIAGRDRTKLVASLSKQVAAVRAVVADVAPEVSVDGCFCFVAPKGLLADSGLPLLRTLSISGHPLFYPRTLARRLNRRGTLAQEYAQAIAAALAERFPPA